MKTIAIAIDGPAGAGKSTIARVLAKKLSYLYVDTGALYRALAYILAARGADCRDVKAVERNLRTIRIELRYENGEQRVYADAQDVTNLIRTPWVSQAASAVSALPAVRAFLLKLQQDIALESNVIMDGRDIGTVVLPNAAVKIFLTASAEARARRRYDELIEKGTKVTFEEVLADMEKRDYDDSHRAIAPLKPADDAVLVDTTNDTLDQAVERLAAIVREKLEG